MSTAHPSPLGGAKPTRDQLAQFANATVSDRIPNSDLRLLIVGVNPGLWTAAVDAPFAHPGNRFWTSLDRAGIVTPRFDVSHGMSDEQEEHLAHLGIGTTNLVARATARADELTTQELIDGAQRVIHLATTLCPRVVAVVGITAYRAGFQHRKAVLGKQDPTLIAGWPEDVALWVVPQPSGLNAHETVETLAQRWRDVWDDSAPSSRFPH